MGTRREHDFIGELEIADDVYYGVQTFRALENFHMSGRPLKDYPHLPKSKKPQLWQTKKLAF